MDSSECVRVRELNQYYKLTRSTQFFRSKMRYMLLFTFPAFAKDLVCNMNKNLNNET